MAPLAWSPSSRAAALLISAAWPGVSSRRKGRPSASQSRWIFVVNPPRERPSAWFFAAPFFARRGLLMGFDEAGVEHDVVVARVLDERGKHLLPHALVGPAAKASMHRLVFAVTRRQIAPTRATAQDPQPAVDKQTVVGRVAARIACLAGQKMGDAFPLVLTQFVASDHPNAKHNPDACAILNVDSA